ncbi:MAG: hypothetical protein ACI4UE_02590 [Candidatus Scatovivens sp.]
MKKIVEFWKRGITWLITDDLISFYTYFTIIFAECAYLWSHFSASVAIPFTIILLAYVLNVIVFAWLKGNWEGTRKELIFSILYVIIFIGLFIIGCIYKTSISIILTIIPLVITFIWIQLRTFQDTINISRSTDKLFSNKFFYILSQVIVIGCPYIVFVIFIAMIPTFPIILKVLIPIIYLPCIPLISLFEDETASCNIFEIAYDITWDK